MTKSKIILKTDSGTCGCYYNAYIDGIPAGQIRVRDGSCEAFAEDGTAVYSALTHGRDRFMGHERDLHLKAACRAILEYPLYEIEDAAKTG